MNTFICKAKTKNNVWVTGYYLELGDDGYILPENTSVDNPNVSPMIFLLSDGQANSGASLEILLFY